MPNNATGDTQVQGADDGNYDAALADSRTESAIVLQVPIACHYWRGVRTRDPKRQARGLVEQFVVSAMEFLSLGDAAISAVGSSQGF